MEFSKISRKYVSNNLVETYAIGTQISLFLKESRVVALYGDLGAGKTSLIKALVAGLNGTNPEQVTSPTFSYLHIYSGKRTVYHFDLYRLKNEEEFLFLGFDEFLSSSGICLIEWAERIPSLLPKKCIRICISLGKENQRFIELVEA